MTLRHRSVDPVARRLGILAIASAGAAVVLDLALSPPDRVQGESVRLMYVHVPSAWTAFASFAVVALASIGYLVRGERRWDALAQAAAELGVGMTALAIAEGSTWGHVVWGTWWTWDPRLVTTALLLLTYVAYLLMRRLPGPAPWVRRRAAVLGAVGALEIVVVHLSVLWWRSLHQPPTILRPSLHDPIAGSMLIALLTSVLAFSLGAAWFVRVRYRSLTAPPAVSALTQPSAPSLANEPR